MAINSKAKGKRGELDWCFRCLQHGYVVRRTAQFCGNNESGAADCVGIRGLHMEVKYVEHLNIYTAMAQSIRDTQKTGKGEIPIVAHRRNNREWLVTLRADDFLELYRNRHAELVKADVRKVEGEHHEEE